MLDCSDLFTVQHHNYVIDNSHVSYINKIQQDRIKASKSEFVS